MVLGCGGGVLSNAPGDSGDDEPLDGQSGIPDGSLVDTSNGTDARTPTTDGSAVDSSSADSSPEGGRVPVNHRTSDAQCQTMPAAGDCAGSLPDSSPACVTDSQCTSGTNGRCVVGGGGPVHDCSCTYDACTHDTDCGVGETCACHGSTYTGDSGNQCVIANCRVDSDCGAGGYCSPSSTLGLCGFSVAGYYCHTAADTCIDDADCSSMSFGGCVYSTSAGHWACARVIFCL
jgi:hypothetical protein